MRCLKQVFLAIPKRKLENWIRADATGRYTRKAWYLYELLTGKTLDIPDAPPTGYVEIVDVRKQLATEPRTSTRHRVKDNLLGDGSFCPMIRRTSDTDRWPAGSLQAEIGGAIHRYDPSLLLRAAAYLYTQETKSSFAIEGEKPSQDRLLRFVQALTRAPQFDPLDEQEFFELQRIVVDPRYQTSGWRKVQNYVSRTLPDYSEDVHFVCPKPRDVPSLMKGWMTMVERLLQTTATDAIAAAAVSSFTFVLIHPFLDGNGRIHRFLLHNILARRDFTPEGILFPIAAAILSNRRAYDQVLRGYSQAIKPFIDFDLSPDGLMTVNGETADLYRYIDATPFAEYLYPLIAETIRTALPRELNWLVMFDEALESVKEIVDMPDRRATLLLKMILQNKGRLGRSRRTEFRELNAAEITRMEESVRKSVEKSGLTIWN